MVAVEPRAWRNITEIKMANRAIGHHWFEPGTMRFFNSRIETREVIGGRYFVTSEQFEDSRGARPYPRTYTIRAADARGAIDTVGEFEGYPTLAAALQAIHDLRDQEAAG